MSQRSNPIGNNLFSDFLYDEIEYFLTSGGLGQPAVGYVIFRDNGDIAEQIAEDVVPESASDVELGHKFALGVGIHGGVFKLINEAIAGVDARVCTSPVAEEMLVVDFPFVLVESLIYAAVVPCTATGGRNP